MYNECRINKKIFNWSVIKGNTRCKYWHFTIFNEFVYIYSVLPFDNNKMLSDVHTVLMSSHIDQWETSLNRDCGVNGAGNNKLN